MGSTSGMSTKSAGSKASDLGADSMSEASSKTSKSSIKNKLSSAASSISKKLSEANLARRAARCRGQFSLKTKDQQTTRQKNAANITISFLCCQYSANWVKTKSFTSFKISS